MITPLLVSQDSWRMLRSDYIHLKDEVRGANPGVPIYGDMA
jgi:hypothetical protein